MSKGQGAVRHLGHSDEGGEASLGRAALCATASKNRRGLRSDVTPLTRSRVRLQSLDDVCREIARVYRMVDRGEIASSEGTRRAYMLATLSRAIEAGVIERRLSALERMANDHAEAP